MLAPEAKVLATEVNRAPYLRLAGIRKDFGSFTALKHIDLDIAQGEFVCFLGPSGCGKTTLLRIIAGLELQTAGRIELAGRDISTLPPAERDYGIVFQSYALFPNLTVAENVAYGLVNRKVPKAQAAARVAELLALVGLPGSEGKFPAQLSGGQQQRIALARALATAPSLLLLDEPLSALDAIVRVKLRQEIRSLQRQLGVTTVMVTHDQEEAFAVADRIVVMNQGGIEQVGDALQVYREPTSLFVADFVGRINVLPARVEAGGGLRVGTHRFVCDHAGAAGRDVRDLPAPGGRAGAPDSRARPQRVRGADREDRVHGPVLPGARDQRRARRAPPDGVPVAQLPGRGPSCRGQPTAAAGDAGADEGVRVSVHVAALAAPVRQRVHWSERIAHVALAAVALALLAFLALPLGAILQQSLQDAQGQFAGLTNFIAYAQTPALLESLWNSIWVSVVVTLVTIPVAFGFAYALTRSRMRFKGLARTITLVPLLAPSLLAAISLIYWFGNQGVLEGWLTQLGVAQIYGAPGIVLAEIFSTFPHALMILITVAGCGRCAPV